MPHAVSMPSPGLQALILCGPGSSFSTFTANPDENPKALLPVANRPMVWYPLDFCYRTGITDITLICPPSASEAITAALNTNPLLTGLPLPRPDILAPKDLDQTTGTAEILRLPEVRSLVTSDFLVLPCDIICEISGDKLLQAWMVKAASLTELVGNLQITDKRTYSNNAGLGVWYPSKADDLPAKGIETDFVGVAPLPKSASSPKDSLLPHVSTLVYTMPTDSLKDMMEEQDAFPIRHGLSKKHPRVRMLTSYRDAHMYVFPKWIMDFVNENEKLETIGEDLVGWWAKAGWQPGLADKLNLTKVLKPEVESQDDDSQLGASISSHGSMPGTPQEGQGSKNGTSVVFGENGGLSGDQETNNVPPILAYIHPADPTQPLIRRTDTAQLLLATSLLLAKLPSIDEAGVNASPFAHPKKVAYPEGIKPKTTISRSDTLIAENVTIAEKTKIKESVVGLNCQINEGVIMAQCVLMEGVIVGKNCKLTKCILGKRCVIGDNTVLTECEVQENLMVEPGTSDKNNCLMSSEGLEATEQEIDEVLDAMEQDGNMAVEEPVEL